MVFRPCTHWPHITHFLPNDHFPSFTQCLASQFSRLNIQPTLFLLLSSCISDGCFGETAVAVTLVEIKSLLWLNQKKVIRKITFKLFLHSSRDAFVLLNIFVSPLHLVRRTHPTSLDVFLSITLPRAHLSDNYFSSWIYSFVHATYYLSTLKPFGRQELHKYFQDNILVYHNNFLKSILYYETLFFDSLYLHSSIMWAPQARGTQQKFIQWNET